MYHTIHGHPDRKKYQPLIDPKSIDEFQDIVEENTHVLVKFTSPFCPTSTRHIKEFEEASQILEGEIPFIKVDVDTHKTIAEKFNVKDFPEYRFFINGDATEYCGGAHGATFVDWVRFMTAPTIIKNDEDLKPYHHLYRPRITLSGPELLPGFKEFAEQHKRWAIYKYNSTKGSNREGYQLQIAHNQFKEETNETVEHPYEIQFSDASQITYEEIKRFIYIHRIPHVGILNTFTSRDYDDYPDMGHILVMLPPYADETKFGKLDHQRVHGYEKWIEISKRFRNTYFFSLVDMFQMAGNMNQYFNIRRENLPALIITKKWNDKKNQYFRYQKHFNPDTMEIEIKSFEEKLKQKEARDQEL